MSDQPPPTAAGTGAVVDLVVVSMSLGFSSAEEGTYYLISISETFFKLKVVVLYIQRCMLGRIEVKDTGSLTQNKMCISMLFPMM